MRTIVGGKYAILAVLAAMPGSFLKEDGTTLLEDVGSHMFKDV